MRLRFLKRRYLDENIDFENHESRMRLCFFKKSYLDENIDKEMSKAKFKSLGKFNSKKRKKKVLH